MNQLPIVSVVICTHNRVLYLVKSLQGLLEQTVDSSLFEVLVVDNRSTDNTRKLVDEFKPKLDNLAYYYEEELGLSAARNRGLREARGKYIAYLDDDAIPDTEWLKWVLDGFHQGGEKIGFLGGKVIPIWEVERPDWLSDQLLPYLTVVDLGDKVIEVEDASGLVGANMSFPKKILEELGGFPTQLGRKGKNLLSNEELVLKLKLQDAGYNSIYHPRALVSHHAPRERVSKHWFRRRLYWQGQSDAVWWRLQEKPGLTRKVSEFFFTMISMLKEFVHVMQHLNNGDQQKRFQPQVNVLYHFGRLLGIFRRQVHE